MSRGDPDGTGEPSRPRWPSAPREHESVTDPALRYSEQIFDALPVACCIVDTSGHVVRANAAFAIELGATCAGGTGQSLAVWFSASQRDALERQLRRVAGPARRRHELGRFELADRGTGLRLVAVGLDTGSDEPRALVTLAAAEAASPAPESAGSGPPATGDEPELREAMARELEAMGALASSIVHDFGNLLQGVMGCLTLALNSTTTPVRARDFTQQALNAVRKGTARIAELKGLGARRKLALPSPESSPSPAPAAPDTITRRARSEPHFSGRALLVEDDWRVRIGIRYYLQQLGFEVIEAGNVGEALSHANGTVGLLVTDVILPEVTGPGIRQLLRQAQPELKALYISAHPARYLIDQGLVGADDVVLQKPFDLQEFAYRLEEVCCSAPPAAAAPAPVHAPVG
ncbi:MAG TPA: response regulator [Polyangiaceae bacterium]|nr:response regulator [Polyangiaceae bacterium]